ncbi:MAG: inositol monophosphatase [Myxococcales bacterium]|nr:inositol monophosphatase [Myxococcales bacterium]
MNSQMQDVVNPRVQEDLQLLDSAQALAAAAGEVLLSGLGRSLIVETKSDDTDLVTRFDREAETVIVDGLRARYPHHRILAEEGGERPGEHGAPCWIIDPLDGTTNFAHGLPLFSVSIACLVDGVVRVGVVLAPAMGWRFAAVRGQGATLNGRPIGVSQTESLDSALLTTGFPYDRRTSPANNLAQFVAFKKRVRGIRRLGSAALDLSLVAAGKFDGYWEMKLKPWDIAAGTLICEEAGGLVTNWSGGPLDLFRGEVLASNRFLHDSMLSVLQGVHTSL